MKGKEELFDKWKDITSRQQIWGSERYKFISEQLSILKEFQTVGIQQIPNEPFTVPSMIENCRLILRDIENAQNGK
jgi:hypothetical protein